MAIETSSNSSSCCNRISCFAVSVIKTFCTKSSRCDFQLNGMFIVYVVVRLEIQKQSSNGTEVVVEWLSSRVGGLD